MFCQLLSESRIFAEDAEDAEMEAGAGFIV